MYINTNRLTIRKVTEEDWMGIKNIAADFQQSEYVIYDHPLPTEDHKIKDLTKRFAESDLFFTVFLKDSSEMIGYISLHNDGESHDIGYCFHSDYFGKGYAFESCSEVIKHMEQHNNVKVFTAGTALKNEPSCMLLKKLGFVLKERESLAFHKDEAGEDIVFEGGHFIRASE